MDRGDRRLELVRTRLVAAQAGPDEFVALVDEAAIPARPVLVGEADQRPVGTGPRRSPGLGEQHQGEEPNGFGFVGHQLDQDVAEPDCFARQVDA